MTGVRAKARLAEFWDTFVMEDRGVRCVSDEQWVTAAETSECAIAHVAAGDRETAKELLLWTMPHRRDDGSYWTGIVYPVDPDQTIVHFPADERTAYTAAAVIMAADAISGGSPASRLFTVPMAAPLPLGDPWTVVVEFDEGPPAVGVGRVLRPHFPLEAWPHRDECPIPEGDANNYAAMRGAGLDTMYHYWNDDCGPGADRLLNELLPDLGDYFVLLGDDVPQRPADRLRDTRGVAGFLTGDESDGEFLDDNGYPVAAGKAGEARALWAQFPEVAVYNGGKTNGQVGTLAGATDIQGMDFYAAA